MHFGVDMDLLEIGRLIREKRKSLKITQSELCKSADISRATLSQLENASLPEIGYVKLSKILDCLELQFEVVVSHLLPTLDDIVREQENEERTGRLDRFKPSYNNGEREL